MLPAVVLILFFNGMITAAHFVLSKPKGDEQRNALLIAVIIGIIPAWQTLAVWNAAGGFDPVKNAPQSVKDNIDRTIEGIENDFTFGVSQPTTDDNRIRDCKRRFDKKELNFEAFQDCLSR